MKSLGTLFIIAAASGTGKTSLANALVLSLPDIKISISHTTRPIRQGETDGVSYFFIDETNFKDMITKDLFLEYAEVFGFFYGTSRQWVLHELEIGNDVILDIDWQGAQKVRELMPQNTVSIFLLPPSRAILKKRLETRNRDTADIVSDRLQKASGEIQHYKEFDYLIVNDAFEAALADLCSIISAHRLKTSCQELKHTRLLADLLQKQ
jgi:guanylate kinase